MKTTRTTAILLVLAALVIVGAGAAGYAFRAGLPAVPFVGALFGRGQEARAAADDPDEVLHWTCPMHPHVEEQGPGPCPECGMDLVPVTHADAASAEASEPEERLARAPVTIDARRQQLLGVRVVPVERKALSRTIRTVGTVEYDETRLADVTLKVDGWIEQLFVDYTGRLVSRGDPLFSIYSPDLVTTQHEYLLALRTEDQLKQSEVDDARVYAERLVRVARQRLELWDLPPDELQGLDEQREPRRTMTFRSPVSGVVVEKRVVSGAYVRAGEPLYRVADLSAVWVEADIYESEIALLRQGQQATVTLDAYPGESFTGRVVYVYPYVEPQTRTGRARLQLPNPHGRLKPGLYGHVAVDVPLADGLTVPTNALLDAGTRQYVFVSLGDGLFEPRRVRAGQRLADEIQILEGLEEGEQVATQATFFIDAESQLRAALDGFAAPPPPVEAAARADRLDITYRSQPDPPSTGATRLEVDVRDPDGQPITDAEVEVTYFMAAMPTMNMPAMRTDAALTHVGDGVYRGTMQVLMGGRWEVTVNVTRDGRRIGSRQLTVVAR